MVIAQGLRLALVGLAIGAIAALILTRVLSSFSHLLYGVGAGDPLTFLAVSLVLLVVQPSGLPESIAGLPGSRAMVCVGPPLLCKGPRSGSVLFRSPVPLKLQLSSLLRL